MYLNGSNTDVFLSVFMQAMSAKDKQRFEDMAEKDKVRFDKEMATYVPPADSGKGKKKGAKKDPNAPKRAL
jgi:hypothetical protein